MTDGVFPWLQGDAFELGADEANMAQLKLTEKNTRAKVHAASENTEVQRLEAVEAAVEAERELQEAEEAERKMVAEWQDVDAAQTEVDAAHEKLKMAKAKSKKKTDVRPKDDKKVPKAASSYTDGEGPATTSATTPSVAEHAVAEEDSVTSEDLRDIKAAEAVLEVAHQKLNQEKQEATKASETHERERKEAQEASIKAHTERQEHEEAALHHKNLTVHHKDLAAATAQMQKDIVKRGTPAPTVDAMAHKIGGGTAATTAAARKAHADAHAHAHYNADGHVLEQEGSFDAGHDRVREGKEHERDHMFGFTGDLVENAAAMLIQRHWRRFMLRRVRRAKHRALHHIGAHVQEHGSGHADVQRVAQSMTDKGLETAFVTTSRTFPSQESHEFLSDAIAQYDDKHEHAGV